jgi:glutamate-1-semialdehyde 2,1-aminomutase
LLILEISNTEPIKKVFGVNTNFSKSKVLQQRAQKVMPLGVNSNFRYWGDGMTPYMDRAKGAYLWDVDGNKYIDYRMAFGPIILGHADEAVNTRVKEEIDLGTLSAMTYELEIEVMEKIVAMCPAVEMARLACSGTEATMHAVRVARAYTGRQILLKFEGNYHGFHDYTLWSTYSETETYGNIHSPIPVPSSSGIPKILNDLIITLSFNDFEGLEKTLKSYGYQIAAIITEPCQGNCAGIEPLPGFLQFIRQKCDEYGIVFILDEVKTGFRIANGGAQEYFGIRPDLATYAKAMGNGYPVAAFGGNKEIMNVIGHGVAQGGTYTNNKPGVAAAWVTLDILQNQPVLKTIEQRGSRLMNGLKGIFEEAGIPVCFSGYPAMFSFAVGREKIVCQRDWNETEKEYYLRLVEAAIERGVMPDHDPREPWFLCYAHGEAEIDRTLEVMSEVVKVVSR